MKLGTVMLFNPLDRYKFEILKIQDGDGRHLEYEKSKNRDVSPTV